MAQVAGVHIEQLTYGVWFMAAIVAYLIIPKPGIALIAEFAAGAGETIVMGKFDIPTIVYAILQGLACEIIFAIFKYKSRIINGCYISRISNCINFISVDYYYGYLAEVAGWNLLLFIIFRSISGIVIAGLLSYLIVKALRSNRCNEIIPPCISKRLRQPIRGN